MSFTDDFYEALNKKKKKQQNDTIGGNVSGGNSYTEEFMSHLDTNISMDTDDSIAPILNKPIVNTVLNKPIVPYVDEIAPVKGGNKNSIFKAGAYADGADMGDLGATIIGTVGDLGLGLVKGAGRLVEGIVDLGTYGVAGVASLAGADEFAEKTKKVAQYSATDEWTKGATDFLDQYSVLGNKADMVAEGLGQVATIILTGGAAGAAAGGTGAVATAASTAATTAVTGLSGMGSGMNEAYLSGASDGEAVAYGALTGSVEAVSELVFGGLGKGFKAVGISKGLSSIDDVFAKKLSNTAAKYITSEAGQKVVGNALEYTVKSGAEGLEEVISGVGSGIAKKLTYMSEEEIGKILEDENLLEQFVVGTIVSGIAQGGDLVNTTTNSRDFVTGLSTNEQSVVDKVYEDAIAEQETGGKKLTANEKNKLYDSIVEQMDKGQLSIDTIEGVLGGKTYEEYTNLTERKKALTEEISGLENTPKEQITVKQSERLTEAREELSNLPNETELKAKLSEEVYGIAKDSRLVESYNERARKGQAFEADLTKYTGKQKEAVERAIKSGVLNNTYRSHELVDTLAKIEADKGITFDYTNNERLKESGFAVEGKTVNGFVKDGGVTLNVQSPKAWQSTVGHEITHVLEGTEHYSALREALYAYAESKGELDSRKTALTKLYEGMDADIDAELTADLVGEYLFTDKGFINKLTGNRNLFQKIYDEIKYLWNVATGKEKASIEKVKREFDKVWDELNVEGKGEESGDVGLDKFGFDESGKSSDTKYSISPDIEKGDFGYHAGDLGKAEGYWNMTSSKRSTGHFGTGTYFVGDEAQISDNFYGNRPHEKVDFSKYKLYKPLFESDGFNLHESLKYINDNISLYPIASMDFDEMYDTYKQADAAEWTLYWDDNASESEKTEAQNILGELKERFEIIGYDAETWDADELKSRLTDIRNDYSEAKIRLAGLFSYKKSNGYLSIEETENRVDSILQGVYEETSKIEDAYSARYEDSPSTRFMKAMGYEGVDVRGIKELDNVAFGSVIYDLKGEDLARKKEIGTARYSISEKNDADYLKAIESGDTETTQKMVDEAAKNAGYSIKAYHGTGYNFTVFDKSKQGDNYQDWGRLGKGFYFAPTSREAKTWAEHSRGSLNKVMPVYLRIENMLDSFEALPDNLKDTIPADWDSLTRRLAEKYAYNYIEYMQEFGYNVQEILTEKGYDGINGHAEFVVYDPEQVKSADAVTYDDKGNVISLSERFNTANEDIRYSLSKTAADSEGNQLSERQQAYFADSKVRDNNGNLLVMYHGTPNGDFTVFRDGTYFTENKWYADLYQNPGASSLNSRKVATNPQTFKVYLDIKKPFDIADSEARNIYINDYIKGGNAVGINPYLSDAEYENISSIDWTEGEDLRDFLIENGYDYDGLILDEGAVGGYGDDVKYRGKSYVTFSPEQVKNVDNKNPSADPDIRFSLSKSVEETKDLVAIHNLQSSELAKTLELGGLPMPSIAVIKAEQGHEQYGDVSLIFPKDAIDPQQSKDNKVYGGDAWTPTYPRIEYKANESVEKKISHKYYELANEIGYDEVRPMYRYAENLEDSLNRDGGEAAMLEKLYDDTGMMQVYLQDIGKGKVEPILKETRTEISEADAQMRQYFIDALGADMIAEFAAPDGQNPLQHKRAYVEQHESEIRAAYKQFFMEQYGFSETEADNALKSTNNGQLLKIIRDVYNYTQNNGVTVKTETDTSATNNAIRNAAADGYKEWVDSLFGGVQEKSGIRNNQDYYTRSGNQRSWEALHWENTLENVVKAMKEQNSTGVDSFSPFNSLFGSSHKQYGSIQDIKADSDRLGKINQDEFDAMKDSFSNRFAAIAESIKDPGERNPFIATDTAAEQIIEAVRTRKTKEGILNHLKKLNSRATMQTVEDVISLVSDIANMPTGYFEAKPQRAVGLEEVGVFVIPNNADVKLKQELLNKGYNIAEYDPNVEGDRRRVVNQFEEYKFSLSNVGEESTSAGNYSTPLKEVALEEDIAPVAETVSKPETEENLDVFPDNYEPVPPAVEWYDDRLPDTTSIDEKSLRGIASSVGDILALNSEETKTLREVIQNFSTSETQSADELYEIVKSQFGDKVWRERFDEAVEVKQFLRDYKLQVSDSIKADIPDYSAYRKRVGARIRTPKDGVPVDVAYRELSSLYPHMFSPDIINESDQFQRICEVAMLDSYISNTETLSEETIQNAVDVILSEIGKYKSESLRMAIEEFSDEKLNSIAPPKAEQIIEGMDSEARLLKDLDHYPVETVEQRLAVKLQNVEQELMNLKQLSRESIVEHNKQIEQLTQEYLAKKDKQTGVANNLIRRILNLETRKNSVEATYAKRISDLETRLEKMKTPKYKVAMQKQAKMQEHAKWAENLVGDTSTWKDKKLGLQYAVNTERRNLRDIVRDENGNADIARADAIDEALGGKYNQEEAAKKRELAKVRKKYADLKITNAEAEYIQMLGELRHNPSTTLTEKAVNEYYEKHKAKIDTAKVDRVIDLARQDYDYYLNKVNEKLREQGMKEIPYRQGYFPHYTDPKQNFIQRLLNWKTQDNEIPTSIAGLTETFKPVKSWQSFDKTRHSDTTDYNFLKGFDSYMEGALDWIYHIDTLQKRRAVENYIRYTHSDEGIQARIKEVYANEELDADEAQVQIEHILAEAKNPLNNFIQDFTTHTNILAGKKNSLDRTVEQWTNRHIYSVMTNVQSRLSANMVLANVRSALTNFIPITQSWAQVSPVQSLKATKDTIANAIKDDGITDKSTFLTNRLKTPDRLYQSNWDKVLDKAGIMFEIVDNFSSQVIWRSKYNQNLAKGMAESEAIKNADQFAENVMAGRSKGNEPTLFNAKNPLVKAFTAFQLEVNNQYGYLFKDVPNDLKTETNHWKLNLAKGYATAFIGAYVYNALLEKVAGSGAALDPIGIIEDLLKDLGLFDDDEKEEPLDAIGNFAENVVQEIPFVGGLLGGGRVPLSSAIPYDSPIKMVTGTAEDIANEDWGNLANEWSNPFYNLVLPVGGGQLKKTVQGLGMFSDEHPVSGSYTASGNLRFPVEDTPLNRVQAGLFGQYASENAREYFNNDYAPLKEKQIQEYMDVDIPIKDYWEYREGLKKQETLEEKFDYISGLDLPVAKKNILINNVVDRKEKVDLENYDDFSGLEEFDFATKNPEKYAFAKSVGGYSAYKTYSDALYDIKADKDENGKTINGSRKEKVLDYINNLDADYETKIILFKSEYPSVDDYNAEIIDYVNSIEGLTYEERVAIFTELGFRVTADGQIYAD